MLLISAVLLHFIKLSLASDWPFQEPQFPLSTIDNDGTRFARYDVRKTMVWLDDRPNLNSYFFVLFLTLTDGRQFEVTVNPLLRGSNQTTGIYVLNDLTEKKTIGSSVFTPGTGDASTLDVRSQYQNLSSPVGGDNFTDLHLTADYAGVSLDVHMNPTGPNLYFGGVGGFNLPAITSDPGSDDYTEIMPGWCWYWANPHLRVQGSLRLDGKQVAIDTSRSFAWFERQTGKFNLQEGYILHWLYLSNGLVLQTWILDPDEVGASKGSRILTVWHPDGTHSIPIFSHNATEVWTSGSTGSKYFGAFTLEVPSSKACLNIRQAWTDTEVGPHAGTEGFTISESSSEGSGVWMGENVSFFGHTEQLRPM